MQNINTNQYSSVFIHLVMTARCQSDVYTEHKRCHLTSNTSAEIFFSNTQNILNVGTVKHVPTQAHDFI